MLRSATFGVGILLAVGAFAGFIVLGTVLNPSPYQVVIAMEDIPAYSTLSSESLAVDAQTMSSTVAQGLVARDELDQYLGSFTIETIRAGEPVRKSAIINSDNPQALNRIALMLDDPERVAMVVPVDPTTAPEQVEAGDFVDIVLSLAPGSINANNQSNLSELLATPTGQSTSIPRATPTLAEQITISTTVLSADEMNLPVAKVTIQKVPVLAVRRERIANPNFAVGPMTGESQASSPAFVAGDIQAVLVSVPRTSVELLTFAMDNGRIHLSLLSPRLANEENDGPTLGLSWNDVIAWMMAERGRASGQVVVVAASTVTPTVLVIATPTATLQAALPPALESPTPFAPPISAPSINPPNLGGVSDLMANVSCIALPLGAGILLVVAAFFVIRRVRG